MCLCVYNITEGHEIQIGLLWSEVYIFEKKYILLKVTADTLCKDYLYVFLFLSWPDKNKAEKICQERGCGSHSHIPNPGLFIGNKSEENVVLNCDAKDQFSWQCMEPKECLERASVICNSKCKAFRSTSLRLVAFIVLIF